jgi:DNA-binding MarR family transcriptional regulator
MATVVPDSPLDAIETRIVEGLRAAAAAVGRAEATARVLLALGPEGGATMRDVARRIARDPSTVTRFVIRAVRERLVEQRPGTDDRRERRLHLTPLGQSVRSDLLARRLAHTQALKDAVQARTGLSADEVEWFLRVLHGGLEDARGVTA